MTREQALTQLAGTPADRLPKHVAIIMDGNGRWAKKHRLRVALGHRAGMEKVVEIIRVSNDIGLKVLTLFAFSTENGSRSPDEVSALMALLVEYVLNNIDELMEKNVHIRVLGDKRALPIASRDVLMQAERRTKDNTGMNLNLAVNYGGRDDIVRACRLFAQACVAGNAAPDDMTEALLSGYLYTTGQPDVDLVIRTSGEVRMSNFLLYQCAYAEMTFPQALWPDYTTLDYLSDLLAYAARERRFGGRRDDAARA